METHCALTIMVREYGSSGGLVNIESRRLGINVINES